MVARPQMELQALKDQLEVERQLWEANCAKKEVGTVGGGGWLAPSPQHPVSGWVCLWGLPWARSWVLAWRFTLSYAQRCPSPSPKRPGHQRGWGRSR